MKLSDNQIREVDKILERKSLKFGGIVSVRFDANTKFKTGDCVKIILNDYGEFIKVPRVAIVLACYEQLNSNYGDYPELYILELEGGKVEHGFMANVLIKSENVYGY